MGQRYYRRVIQITAEDSPNVQLAMLQIARGEEPTGEEIIPGVLTWDLYKKRRATWDKIRQCIGLDAKFYDGAEILLYPPEWLDRAEEDARRIKNNKIKRLAKAIGVDVAMGGDSTSLSAVDDYGLIACTSEKTPDTSVIPDMVLAFAYAYGCASRNIWFDSGGGGKVHVDNLRAGNHRGVKHNVQSVWFGESVTPKPKLSRNSVKKRIEHKEERSTYMNRRAEIYHLLHLLMNPSRPLGNEYFTIPEEYTNLRDELSVMPLLYDREGRIRMLPKNKKDPDDDEPTLEQLIGHSPDEADSLALAVYGARQKPKIKLGAR